MAFCCVGLSAQQPGSTSVGITSFNEGWSFTKDSAAAWEPVSLPHCWNTNDLLDDEPGYYRGVCWYRHAFRQNVTPGELIYLRFEAANQVARVYVNGHFAGEHIGGYSAFQFRIDSLLENDGNNELLVSVDNRFNADVAPLTADFSFIGGLYRDAWLIRVPPVHFDLRDHGSFGVCISTANAADPSMKIRARIVNQGLDPTGRNENYLLTTQLIDDSGKVVREARSTLSLRPHSAIELAQEIGGLQGVHRWSPADPYLYTVVTTLTHKRSGKILDRQLNHIGFRYFFFDPQLGLLLNGSPLKLIGTSRHQDRAGVGNAVSDDLSREDVWLLKEMGGNFLRVAHYPQDPSVLEACDRLGIFASVEIPVVNEITESGAFTANCREMELDMIRQNCNHTSVLIWCYMNEVLLRPHFNDNKPRQTIYFNNVARLARSLDSLARIEDPDRYTMIANHGDFNRYRDVGLTAIPMIVGWNLYSGWYGGELKNFAEFMDRHHRELADRPMMITEYGADADPRIHSLIPARFDKSIEYALRFHQYYLQEIMKRPFVSGAVVWNLADFSSETRGETMPHINNKGLLQWDRKPKDLYYFYKAMLSKAAFVKIGWVAGTGIADSIAGVCYQPVNVFSNLDSVELLLNHVSLGVEPVKQGIAAFRVPLVGQLNEVIARSPLNHGAAMKSDHAVVEPGDQWAPRLLVDPVIDSRQVKFQLIPYRPGQPVDSMAAAGPGKAGARALIQPGLALNILCGAQRSFVDESTGLSFIPDQPYRIGSWGSVGGKPFTLKGNTRLPYGTDKNILGTDSDPVYQAQLVGISAYRFDVPAGQYELTLHFAELEGVAGEELAYNLSGNGNNGSLPMSDSSRRVFDVRVNDQLIIPALDLATQYGRGRAVSFKFSVYAKRGIVLSFQASKGEAVLNAIQLRRI